MPGTAQDWSERPPGSAVPHPAVPAARPPAGLSQRLDPAAVLALQRTAGNAAVSRLMRAPAAPAQEQVRVVERLPTIPEPGVRYVIGKPERRYDFEVTIHERSLHFRQLTPQEVVTKLRMVWRLAHEDLDDGRKENERLVQRRKNQNVAGYWSDLFGGVEVPDPDMWNAVGSGPLAGVRNLLDSAQTELETRRAASARETDRNLSPELEGNPLMHAALAFDATEERIRAATALLERAAANLRECQRRLDEYVKGSTEGAARAIIGIKVTIVVLTAAGGGEGAEFAGEGAGIFGKAFASAGTTAVLGVAGEFFNQVGEIRIGEREHFDIARIAKVGAKDFVTAFVGGVVGGKFSKVLKDRLGGWVYGLSNETLAAYGLTREKLLSNAERVFAEWIATIGASPFMTVAAALTDRALDGKFHADTMGDFAHQVLDDMISSGKMGGLLVYGNHALGGHAVLPVSGERPAPPRQATTPEPEPTTPRPETRVMEPSSRRFPTSVEELRRLVTERLRQAQERMHQEGGPRSELDHLLGELRTRDPEFAALAEEYVAALQDPDFIEAQIEYLWDQARRHGRTVADELEYILGGGKPAINEYRNRPGSRPPEQEFAEFRAAIADPRTFIDLGLADDVHGAHIHAFQEFLGDRLWGRGMGREFRQRLAALEGPSRTVHAGTPRQYEQPFWSRTWDAIFDTTWPNLHAPEVLGRILQELVDFPRWQP